MRRHVIPYRTIHMDKLPEGNHIYRTDNGEEIVVKKNGYGIRACKFIAMITAADICMRQLHRKQIPLLFSESQLILNIVNY